MTAAARKNRDEPQHFPRQPALSTAGPENLDPYTIGLIDFDQMHA